MYFLSNLLQIFIQKLVLGTNSASAKYAGNLQVLAITRLLFLVIIILSFIDYKHGTNKI